MKRAYRARWGRIALFWVVWVAFMWGVTQLWGCEGAYAGEQMTREEANAHLEPYFNEIVDAIYLAEGGKRAVKPFGILSVPCSDYADCRKVAFNTVRNNYWRWDAGGRKGEYLAFLAGRYCPVGASNDPKGLNRNWLGNVERLINR